MLHIVGKRTSKMSKSFKCDSKYYSNKVDLNLQNYLIAKVFDLEYSHKMALLDEV